MGSHRSDAQTVAKLAPSGRKDSSRSEKFGEIRRVAGVVSDTNSGVHAGAGLTSSSSVLLLERR
jgi:hypothetical protein